MLKHLQKGLTEAKAYALQKVSEHTTAVSEALQELNNGKADKVSAVSLTIPTTGWKSDTSVSQYPSYCDIAVSNITAKDGAQITLAPNSLGVALSCGLCSTVETMAGVIRVRAKAAPSTAISSELRILVGRG